MSGGWATGPDSTRTGRSTSRLQPAARTGGGPSAAGRGRPAPSSQQRRGKASLRQGAQRQGRTPPPPAAPAQGAPQHSAWLPVATPGRAAGCPAQGLRGQLLLGAKPSRGTAIYLDVGPAPSPVCPLQEEPHFTSPAPSRGPQQPWTWAPGDRRLTPPWYVARHLQCRGAGFQPLLPRRWLFC